MKLEVGQKYRIKEITDLSVLRERFVPILEALPVGTEVTIVRLSRFGNPVHTVSTTNHKAISCHEARLVPMTPEDPHAETDF